MSYRRRGASSGDICELSNDQLAQITDAYFQGLMVQKPGESQTKCPALRLKRGLNVDNMSPIKGKKIAIFITGSAGSGKSYIQRYVFSSVPEFKYYVYNPDIYVELLMEEYRLIQKEGEDYIKGSPKKQLALMEAVRDVIGEAANPDYLTKCIEDWKKRSVQWFLGIGQRCSKEEFYEMMKKGVSMVIDRPGDKGRPGDDYGFTVFNQINLLKKSGYDVYMIMVYADLETVLMRNESRARSLPSHIVKNIWKGVNDRYEDYDKGLRTKNIIVIYNKSSPRAETKELTSPERKIVNAAVSLEEARETFKGWFHK